MHGVSNRYSLFGYLKSDRPFSTGNYLLFDSFALTSRRRRFGSSSTEARLKI